MIKPFTKKHITNDKVDTINNLLSDLSLYELLDLRYRVSQEIVKKEMSRKELRK